MGVWSINGMGCAWWGWWGGGIIDRCIGMVNGVCDSVRYRVYVEGWTQLAVI